MKSAIYTRISRDKAGAGLGVDRQLAECSRLAESLGWESPTVYSDNDISAYSGKPRPDYERMIADIEAGQIHAVIAWHTDRLHRRPTELERFIDVCDAHGVEIRTVQGGDLDLSTASGRMVARMLGAAARHEVEHMVERQKSAKRQAALDGRFRGGRRAFGYLADGMTAEPTEAQVIRDACRDLLAGKSISAITREWNARGIRTSTGAKWRGPAVNKVLLRERNAGYASLDGARIDAGWETIVDRETFTAVESLLSDPARRTCTSWERVYQGSNVYVCGKCGAPMGCAGPQGKKVYRCTQAGHLSRMQDTVDSYISEIVIQRLSAEDAALSLHEPSGVDTDALRSRRQALGARLDDAAAMFADGTLTADQLRVATRKLRADLDGVAAEISEAQRVSALANLTLNEGDLREAWEILSPDLRGKVISELMTVTILPTPRGRKPGGGYFDPESVQIEWKV